MPDSRLSGGKGTRIFLKYSSGSFSEKAKSHSPLSEKNESRFILGRGYSFHGQVLSISSAYTVVRVLFFITSDYYAVSKEKCGSNEEGDSAGVRDNDARRFFSRQLVFPDVADFVFLAFNEFE